MIRRLAETIGYKTLAFGAIVAVTAGVYFTTQKYTPPTVIQPTAKEVVKAKGSRDLVITKNEGILKLPSYHNGEKLEQSYKKSAAATITSKVAPTTDPLTEKIKRARAQLSSEIEKAPFYGSVVPYGSLPGEGEFYTEAEFEEMLREEVELRLKVPYHPPPKKTITDLAQASGLKVEHISYREVGFLAIESLTLGKEFGVKKSPGRIVGASGQIIYFSSEEDRKFEKKIVNRIKKFDKNGDGIISRIEAEFTVEALSGGRRIYLPEIDPLKPESE